MAKKKKASSSSAPARGFATTSLPSATKQRGTPAQATASAAAAASAGGGGNKVAVVAAEEQEQQPAISNNQAKKERLQQIKEQAQGKTKSTREVDPKIKNLLRDLSKDIEVARIDNTVDDWRATDVESLPAVQLESSLEHELINLLKPLYVTQGERGTVATRFHDERLIWVVPCFQETHSRRPNCPSNLKTSSCGASTTTICYCKGWILLKSTCDQLCATRHHGILANSWTGYDHLLLMHNQRSYADDARH